MTPAVKGAREVLVDVPNTFFGARYQAGNVGEWRYTVFPDGSGTVLRGARESIERWRLQCTQGVECTVTRDDGSSFVVTANGAPAPPLPNVIDGDALARYLANWVLAGTGTPVPPDPVLLDDVSAIVLPSNTATQPPLVVAQIVENENVAVAEVEFEDVPTDSADAIPVILADQPGDETAATAAQEPMAITPPDDRQILDLAVPVEIIPEPVAAPLSPVVQSEPLPDALITAAPTYLEQINLQCSITTSTSLSYDNILSGSDGPGKLRANFGCSANITDQLTARFALVGYANPNQQEDFDPDFTYAFTYRVTDTIRLGYSNYGGRFDGDGFLDALGSGNLRASFVLPKLTLPNERDISCTASLGLPNPADASVNLACGYSVTDKFRIGATANLYFPGEQGEFDPDYTYTASYRLSDDWQLSYNNYSNNRFPWNKGESPGPGFSGGSLSLTYRFNF